MSALLEQTNVNVKSKRLERKSGQLPSKLRFTSATRLSLKKNIDSKLIEKAIDKLNTVYSQMISAVEIAEKVKAEEAARNKIQENQAIDSQIEIEDKISKMTNSSVILDKTSKLKIELYKLAGRIGTYKNKYAINVKKGFNQKKPKAITVKKINRDVYKNILSKIDLYKVAEKEGIKVSSDGEVVAKTNDVPEWRKLFKDMKNKPSNLTVAIKKSHDEEAAKTKEKEKSVSQTNKVSEEDLSYRKMLGQLGDEFETIKNYEKSTNGVPLQFKEGFETRKNNLTKIFFDLTGIKSKNQKISDDYKVNNNTEFQTLIDEVNGYKEPISEEEHKKIEESLNEYYNSEEVSSKINELNEKDVLYTFNQHMDDIIKNESLLNNKNAEDTVKKSVTETEESKEEIEAQREMLELKKGAEEQARMLKTLYDYIDYRDKFEKEKIEKERKERQQLLDAAKIQAQLWFDKDLIENGSKELADKLFINNLIYDGSKEEAARILNEKQKNDKDEELIFKKSADLEAQRIFDKYLIDNGSKELADKLFINNLIYDGSKEEAARILNEKQKNDKDEELIFKKSADLEAQKIFDKDLIDNGSKELADKLFINNLIYDGSKEEAARILNEKQKNDKDEELIFKKSADLEAQRIFDKYLIDNGSKELAKNLQKNNEYLDILDSANKEARLLYTKSRKEELLENAKELKEKLRNINEEANKIDETIAKYIDTNNRNNELKDNNKSKIVLTEDGYFDPEIIDSANIEASRLFEQNVLADSIEKESTRLFEQNVLADSIEKEATRLFEQNVLADSIEKETTRLFEQNVLADSIDKEATRLFEQNVLADSIEKEATRLFEQNIMAESAEKEAQRLLKETKAENKKISTDNTLEIINDISRYSELVNKSKALLVKQERIININKRVNGLNNSNHNNKKKEVLQSLKQELEDEKYSFLRLENEYNPSNVKAA